MDIVYFLILMLVVMVFCLYRFGGRKKKLPILFVIVEGGADLTERLLWILWMEKNWYCSIHDVQVFLHGDGEAQQIAAAFCLHRQFVLLAQEPEEENILYLRAGMDWPGVEAQLTQFPFLRNQRKTKISAGK